MDTALSTISFLPETKAQMKSFFQSAKNEILSGNTDLVKFKIQLKILTDLTKKLNEDKEIKSVIIDEVKKYPSGDIQVEYQERAKYDFSVCNDSVLDELFAYEKEVKKAIAERKDFLKGINPNNDLNGEKPVVNEDTGEIINAPGKGVINVLTVKLK